MQQEAGVFAKLKCWSRTLKSESLTLYFAARDSRTPWYAKLLIAAVAAYALSPIDLIPDFIPVLGYLDDLIIVPAGIALAVRLVPPEVLTACRAKAETRGGEARPRSWIAAVVIVGVWLLALIAVAWLIWRVAARPATYHTLQ